MDPFTVIDSTRFLVVLAFAIAAPWFCWNLFGAVHDVYALCRKARRWQMARREERLIAHYGRPLGSTVTGGRASNGANLPRETPCRRTTAPADHPWPTRTRTPRRSVGVPR